MKERKEKYYTDITDALIDINCKDCNSLHIKEIDGFYTCLDCGLRNENVIDCGQDWRFYGNDDNKGNDPARCDIPTNELLPKASMGSFVGYSGKETATTKRIRNMNHWYAMPYKESTLLETFNNITIMAQNSGINQCVIEEAKYMYKKVSEVKSSRRTKKEGMKAGSISLACKLKGVPRNCNEIAKICHMKNNKTLRKSIKTFEEIWNNLEMREKGIVNNLNFKDDESDSNSDDNTDDSSGENNDEKQLSEYYRSKIENTQSIKDKLTPINNSTNNTNNTINTNNNYGINEYTNEHSNNERDSDNNNDNDSNSDDDSKNLSEYITKLHRYTSQLGVDDKIFQACKSMFIHIEHKNYLDKHMEYYVTIPEKPANFKDLDSQTRKKISEQIDDVIQQRFTFVHYDGIQKANIDRLFPPDQPDYLDNSVIIIDEIHNVRMSSDCENKIVAEKLLQLVSSAENMRLLLLSATPMYNTYK
jgi:transcription initiation factor TFIIIB Brf1 subunit/transcription initiation factor TFIIB